jgi:hypothetical protein
MTRHLASTCRKGGDPATIKSSPYDYQRRLACGERNDRPEAEWLASGTECNSRLINIPI